MHFLMVISMATRRARNHKGLVEYEKKYHHQSGMILYKARKTRYVNIGRAEAAERACERRKPKSYSEIAENLYKTGPVSIDFSLNPEFARKLWEVLNDD